MSAFCKSAAENYRALLRQAPSLLVMVCLYSIENCIKLVGFRVHKNYFVLKDLSQCEFYHSVIKGMVEAGKPNKRGMHSTIDLLIKTTCFVKEKNILSGIKNICS